MNIDYLYSIINLYLKKETDVKKTTLNIKKLEDDVEFNFNMKKDIDDKTTFMIPYDSYNKHLVDFINMYKEDLMIIDEKYSYDNASGTCYYYVLFKTGRSISFHGFKVLEINNVRNYFYDIRINKDEVRVEEIAEDKQMAYKPRLRLQQAGFSSFANIALLALVFVAIFIIMLVIVGSLSN